MSTQNKPNWLKRTGKEFKDFINRGNLVDLAVAVIMGAAFGAIVTSFVNDLIMPFIMAATGKNINDLAAVINNGGATDAEAISAAAAGSSVVELADGTTNQIVVVFYGKFIQAVVYFIIVALIMFGIVKAYMAMKMGNKNKWFGYSKDEYKAFKAKGMSRSQIRELSIAHAAELEAKAKAEAEEAAKNSVEGILKDIRTLLEKSVATSAPTAA